jgi:hypothetical protein
MPPGRGALRDLIPCRSRRIRRNTMIFTTLSDFLVQLVTFVLQQIMNTVISNIVGNIFGPSI